MSFCPLKIAETLLQAPQKTQHPIKLQALNYQLLGTNHIGTKMETPATVVDRGLDVLVDKLSSGGTKLTWPFMTRPLPNFKAFLHLHYLLWTLFFIHIQLLFIPIPMSLYAFAHAFPLLCTGLPSPLPSLGCEPPFSTLHFIHHLLSHIINYSLLFLTSQVEVKCTSYMIIYVFF